MSHTCAAIRIWEMMTSSSRWVGPSPGVIIFLKRSNRVIYKLVVSHVSKICATHIWVMSHTCAAIRIWKRTSGPFARCVWVCMRVYERDRERERDIEWARERKSKWERERWSERGCGRASEKKRKGVRAGWSRKIGRDRESERAQESVALSQILLSIYIEIEKVRE